MWHLLGKQIHIFVCSLPPQKKEKKKSKTFKGIISYDIVNFRNGMTETIWDG